MCNEETQSEKQPKLHVGGKSDNNIHILIVIMSKIKKRLQFSGLQVTSLNAADESAEFTLSAMLEILFMIS
jgi:hypothetical protein